MVVLSEYISMIH